MVFRSCLSLLRIALFFFFYVGESCVSCCVCFRLFLHGVIIAYMCAMLKIDYHFWIEFTINLFKMHTFA